MSTQGAPHMDGAGESPLGGTEPELETALFITDTGGMLPLETYSQAHLFADEDGVALCGHPSTESHSRSRVAEANHSHHPVLDTRVCGNCSRAVRARIASGDLTSGDWQIDSLLRVEAGDELSIKTVDGSYTMVVESTTVEHGAIKARGYERDPDDAGIEHYTDGLSISLRPGHQTTRLKVVTPGDLTAGLGERQYQHAAISMFSDADTDADADSDSGDETEADETEADVKAADAESEQATDGGESEPDLVTDGGVTPTVPATQAARFEPIKWSWDGVAADRTEEAIRDRVAEAADTAAIADPGLALETLTRHKTVVEVRSRREATALRYELYRLTGPSLHWGYSSAIRSLSRARETLDEAMRERGYAVETDDDLALVPAFQGYRPTTVQ